MTNKIIAACNFAAKKHVGQRRKNATRDPYINHPIEVMSILSECGITDVDTLCGAVLHDTIEDTDATKEELIFQFGNEVCNIVTDCSDNKSLDKVTRKRTQIIHSIHISDKAKLVKLADKYSNVISLLTDPPTTWKEDEIIGYARWCYVVCQNLYGVSGADTLDKLVKGMFEQFNIDNVTDEQLEQYYSFITNK